MCHNNQYVGDNMHDLNLLDCVKHIGNNNQHVRISNMLQ